MRRLFSLLNKYRLMTGLTTICLLFGVTAIVTIYFQAAHQIHVLEKQSDSKDKPTPPIHAEDPASVSEKKSETASEKEKKPATPKAASAPLAAHGDPTKLDIIVNKKHPLTPLSYSPPLTSTSCAGYGSTSINPVALSDFAALCNAAKSAKVPLSTSSSYRSYQTQVSTYNYWVSVSGKAGADRYSARPGYSEHQTGLAVDFQVPGGASLSDFTGTIQQKWLAKNAWKYGFIQRYTTSNTKATGYQAESWHYRYVGKSYASTYTSTGAVSLEQFWGVSGGDY